MPKRNFFQRAYDKLLGNKLAGSKPVAETPVLSFVDEFVWVDEKELKDLQATDRTHVKARLKEFALTETLAHSGTGAYGAPQRQGDETVAVKDPVTGKFNQYRVVKIQTASTGLVAEAFVPVNPDQNQKICINWTGTYSLGTVLADLESAPGEESYRHEEIEILNQINTIVKNFSERTDKKAELIVSGHSLGGALAQQNWHSIQRAIATNIYEDKVLQGDVETCGKWVESEKQYRKAMGSTEAHIGTGIPKTARTHLNANHIQSITLGTWNSAGVLNAVEDSSNQLAAMVNDAGVKQRALFGMVGGDAVQRTGQGTVLSDVSSQEAEISLLKVDKGLEGYYQHLIFGLIGATAITAGSMLLGVPAVMLGGLTFGMLPMGNATAKAHTSKHFQNGEEDNLKCQYYENNTPEGRKVIHDKLTNKSAFLQLAPVRDLQKGLHYLLSHVIAKNKPKTETEGSPAPIRQKTISSPCVKRA